MLVKDSTVKGCSSSKGLQHCPQPAAFANWLMWEQLTDMYLSSPLTGASFCSATFASCHPTFKAIKSFLIACPMSSAWDLSGSGDVLSTGGAAEPAGTSGPWPSKAAAFCALLCWLPHLAHLWDAPKANFTAGSMAKFRISRFQRHLLHMHIPYTVLISKISTSHDETANAISLCSVWLL